MKSWKVELTYGNDVLGEMKIERGIFQGDSLHSDPESANFGKNYRISEK